jgi:hypothetical protein
MSSESSNYVGHQRFSNICSRGSSKKKCAPDKFFDTHIRCSTSNEVLLGDQYAFFVSCRGSMNYLMGYYFFPSNSKCSN